jgi:hypothetical protein
LNNPPNQKEKFSYIILYRICGLIARGYCEKDDKITDFLSSIKDGKDAFLLLIACAKLPDEDAWI